MRRTYDVIIKFVLELVSTRYWLLDYLPTFFKKREGVLLVRLDLIGDFVLWLDSAAAYRILHPNQKITLVVNTVCIELALALDHWDEVIGIDLPALRNNYLYRLRTLIRLRWKNFAIAIQPTFSREFAGDVVIRASFAPERIGYEGNTNNIPSVIKAGTDLWYTNLISNSFRHVMELGINGHFVRSLGAHDFLSGIPVITNTINLPAKFQFNKPYIVIAPGASWQPKMWPVENFVQVIRRLNLAFDTSFILCGGKSDQLLCDSIKRQSGAPLITNVAGTTSLLELIEIIRGARLVITNDSAPVHIAAAVSTPSICILGGGHFGRFLPYKSEKPTSPYEPIAISAPMDCFGCGWHCKFAIEKGAATACISNVSPVSVFNSAAVLINELKTF